MAIFLIAERKDHSVNRKILSFAAAAAVSIGAALTAPVTAAGADTPAPVEPMIVGGHPAATAPPGITSLQYDAPEARCEVHRLPHLRCGSSVPGLGGHRRALRHRPTHRRGGPVGGDRAVRRRPDADPDRGQAVPRPGRQPRPALRRGNRDRDQDRGPPWLEMSSEGHHGCVLVMCAMTGLPKGSFVHPDSNEPIDTLTLCANAAPVRR